MLLFIKDKLNWKGKDVWWPILGISALHLTYSKCTHTAVNTHTHTPWTHTWGRHLCFGTRGAVGGSVPCSMAPRRGIEDGESAGHSLPPTYNSCWTWDSNPQSLDYESNSLTIRPRLPVTVTVKTFILLQNVCKNKLMPFFWHFYSS